MTGTPATPEQSKSSKNRFKKTLNLPKTSFPMRANLVQNEPGSLKRWDAMDLYSKTRELHKDHERFVFHDGPPYANGSIHLGHLMNKCLKDFVVRSRTMMDQDCPFVPGWDCHGLPIEHKVMTEMVESGKIDKLKSLDEDTRRMAIRKACKTYAAKFHKLHTQQFNKLLTLADYKDPYLTMTPAYEGATLDVLVALLEQGLVYRALKPVHWSIANETALAEAELEYEDREDVSVFVDMEAVDASKVYEAFGLEEQSRPETSPSFMIWTTTPWTLPANMAIAVHERIEYALARIDGNVSVLAAQRIEEVARIAGAEDVQVLATCSGKALLGLAYASPLRSDKPAPTDNQPEGFTPDPHKVWTIVPAEYVTIEDGTGLVHTATGHGVDDYQTGLREGLPVYCPVLPDGTYDNTVPDWLTGVDVFKANTMVVDHLRESGHLFFDHTFTHSYPHDWRSKTPVIFRATEQWFVSVDHSTKRDNQTLRNLALACIKNDAETDGYTKTVGFVPEWGQNRMRGMVESRPDWCVSRQRAWGLPIPAFFTPDGAALLTPASTRAVAGVVRAQGSDAWFQLDPQALLAEYDAAADPDAPTGVDITTLSKGHDIFDVWFESGSSWNAVMRERSDGADFPVDLYLEGSDQHRGWFQLSMLTSLGMMGTPPFKTILTHGFMVKRDGRKLSKSAGDSVEDLLKEFGADVLRLWVCSLSYENDVKVDHSFFEMAGERYRKIRNTLRFMLSNLDDFTPSDPAANKCDGHCVDLKTIAPTSLDAWILAEYQTVARQTIKAYASYDFQGAHRLLYNFCNDALSSVYLAAVKDRLYCDRSDAPRRRTTQTVLFELTDGLSRLLAPVLCHTADETHRALWKTDPKDPSRCVHLCSFIESFSVKASENWPKAMQVRDQALAALESARASVEQGGMGVENPLDAGVVLPDLQGVLGNFDATDLADLLGVSRVQLDPAATEVAIQDLRDEPRCERSWKRDGTVKTYELQGSPCQLSLRDAEAVGLA